MKGCCLNVFDTGMFGAAQEGLVAINLMPYYIATQSKMCKQRDGGEGEEEEEEICTPQPSPLDHRINTMRGKSNKVMI